MREVKGKVEMVSEGTLRRLVIHKVAVGDAGEYSVRVGSSELKTTVKVRSSPTAGRKLKERLKERAI